MQVHELIYKAAGLPVPEENPFEWSTLVEETDHFPIKYTIQVLGLDEDGFNKIYLFIAHYDVKKDEVLIDYSGDKVLSLTDGGTITVNFKVLMIRELVGELQTDVIKDGMVLLQQLAELEDITGSTLCEAYEKLTELHPELTDVDMLNITKNQMSLSPLTSGYLKALIYQQLDLTTYGTLSNSLLFDAPREGMVELTTYQEDDSVCVHTIDVRDAFTKGIKLPEFKATDYLINDYGFKVYFKGSMEAQSMTDENLPKLTEMLTTILGDADNTSWNHDTVKLTYDDIGVLISPDPTMFSDHMRYEWKDTPAEQFVTVLEDILKYDEVIDLEYLYSVTIDDRDACGLAVTFNNSKYQIVIG